MLQKQFLRCPVVSVFGRDTKIQYLQHNFVCIFMLCTKHTNPVAVIAIKTDIKHLSWAHINHSTAKHGF